MLRVAMLAGLLLTAPAVAQDQSAQDTSASGGGAPEKIRNVQLARGETCPKGEPGEVVVCSTLEEPYRIPKALRDDKPVAAANQSWVNRAASIDQVGRVAAGLPNTCSPVGSGGQTGCFQQQAQAYAADKRARAADERLTP